MLEHEYALVGGYNRTHVGRWLGFAASSISAGIVFTILTAVDMAKKLQWNVNVPPVILSLAGAGAVYTLLYWIFDRYFWKIRQVGAALKIPDISGQWQCSGIPLNSGLAMRWHGEITIVQSWDRLRVHLATDQSSSDSIAAALLYDAAVGYRLMYHYRNSPRMGEEALAAHHGFAELTFAPGEKTAIGEYFNGRGRNTYGRIELIRRNVVAP